MALFQQSLALKGTGTTPLLQAGCSLRSACSKTLRCSVSRRTANLGVINVKNRRNLLFSNRYRAGDQIPAQMNARLVDSLNISPFQDPTAVFMVILQTIVTERETEVGFNQLQ